ncbi:hypothetical protein EWI61_10895 [Methylolobus aquaticus]|nr:hypothetical protein EWI61_10895 [Methylolobus aquaticus]
MHIKLDIDVTPQELRTFFGLPDVEPLQQEMLEILRRQMASGAEGFDPMVLMRPWLPPHLQSMEGLYGLWQSFQRGSAKPE